MADSEKVSSLPSERERFEAWFSDGNTSQRAIERNRDGDYLLMQASFAWTVWQAASAGRQELLEALKAAEAEIAWWVDNHGCCKGQEEPSLRVIRAAIAKATQGA